MGDGDPIVPNRIEIDTFDVNQEVDPKRFKTKLAHPVIIEKVFFLDLGERTEECMKCRNNSGGILFGFSHEYVDVTRVSRPPVGSDRITTDDDELNFVREQQPDALFEVSVDLQFRIHTFAI